MLGIFIAAVIGLWSVFISHSSPEAAFLGSLGFLWVWYWIWTIVQGVFLALVGLGITGAGAAIGSRGGPLGGLLGLAGGGALSVLITAGFAVKSALLLGGVWMLRHSGNPELSFSDFDQTKLIVGGLMLVVGLIMSKSSGSSSRSSSSD